MEFLDQIGAFLLPILMGFITKFPVLAAVIVIMGIMRAIFKPIMAVLHAYTASTANPADDAALEKVEASTAFKIVAWVIDFLGSIKLKP